LKQTDKAEEAFKKGLELDENSSPLSFNLARLYTQKQSYDQAIAQYEKVIKVNPQLPSPYVLLGTLYT
jgi:tetratricopeptide (TPR) repeat protein